MARVVCRFACCASDRCLAATQPSTPGKVWLTMGILPFAVDPLHLYMAIISWPLWPGFVKEQKLA